MRHAYVGETNDEQRLLDMKSCDRIELKYSYMVEKNKQVGLEPSESNREVRPFINSETSKVIQH